MKNKDILLLSTLRANSRETLTKISKFTKIPISTIFDRLKYHEQSTIKKHTIIVDFTKLGYSTRVKMTLKCKNNNKEELKNYLLKNPNINSIFKINNGYDFLVEGIFKNLKELEDFCELLDEKFSLKSKQVYYVIEDIKREAFMSDPKFIDLMQEDFYATA